MCNPNNTNAAALDAIEVAEKALRLAKRHVLAAKPKAKTATPTKHYNQICACRHPRPLHGDGGPCQAMGRCPCDEFVLDQ